MCVSSLSSRHIFCVCFVLQPPDCITLVNISKAYAELLFKQLVVKAGKIRGLNYQLKSMMMSSSLMCHGSMILV